MLFEQAVYEYVDDKQFGRKRVRPNTMEGYLSAIKCHLMPKWQGREMESIGSDELQEWLDGFELPGAADNAWKTFRQVYRWWLRAYRVRIYDETQGVEPPTAPRRKPNALTARQANEAMRDMRGQGFEACALVQLSCGLRPCEAVALTWADVNLSTGEVSVTKGLHEAFGEVYESPTKTEKSTRTVVLPRYAVDRLRELRRAGGARRSDRLCPSAPSKYRRQVRSWFAKRGLKMCAQWLRHTFGTLSLQAGTPIETVALMLGHEGISTAYEHYLVGNSAIMRDAQRAFGRLILDAA
ncbi:MAG: site-specific integrase [Eggerthellaceae bacterium]|nr:site-specific integrase [Eggerthellaceae bacterium]